MRADVLPLLALELDTNKNPTGRRLVNDADLTAAGETLNTVTLPDEGVHDDVPESAGATLVVVYQDPSATAPLRRIVVFDGGHILARGETTNERVRGFYQAVHTSAGRSQLTHILASTDYDINNSRPTVSFNNVPIPGSTINFGHVDNDHRAWLTQTLDVTAQMANVGVEGETGEQFTTSITRPANDANSCITEVATIFSTTVTDVDEDGLLDIVEDPSPFRVTKLRDPNGQVLPQLQLMGARVGQKDLFVEVTAMRTDAATTYGSANAPFNSDKGQISVVTPPHNHMPTPSVLQMAGDALGRAGIRAHFDVGPPSVYRNASDAKSIVADAYLIGAGVGDGDSGDSTLARGGESFLERRCDPATEPWCQFPDFPGTVDWKLQYQQLRDAWVRDDGGELDQAGLVNCATRAGSVAPCRRRFDANRNHIFRTVLFSHARGMSRSPFPCVPNGVASPTTAQLTAASVLNSLGNCASGTSRNPQFHVPQRSSGVSDLPGQSAMVSLGLSKDGLGTEFFQASTLLHEIGHLLDLWHGGGKPVFTPVQQSGKQRMQVYIPPNCGTVQSSMSYLYQLQGLIDSGGTPHIDYSGTTLGIKPDGVTNEASLDDGFLYGSPRYRTAFYAPLVPGSRAAVLGAPAAAKHCDGSPLLVQLNAAGVPVLGPNGQPIYLETPMARLETDTVPDVGFPIDWAGDGSVAEAGRPQDINFDGSLTTALKGANDLATLRVNQIGGSQNAAGVSSGIAYAGGIAYGGGSA